MKSERIVDWERDAPQWPGLVAAAWDGAKNPSPTSSYTDGPLARIYGPLAQAGARDSAIVVGQMGQSLDGRTATVSGHSHYVNGPAAILHLHRLRALVDAVVIGVGTAIADDPQLTVRHVAGPQPARVIIDPNGRLPETARCLQDDGVRRIVIGRGPYPAGIQQLSVASGPEGFAPAAIVTALRECGLRRLLIEGGGHTVSRFLAAGVLDRLHVMVAPMIIGAGPVGLSFGAIQDLKDALRPAVNSYTLPQGDVLFDCAWEREPMA